MQEIGPSSRNGPTPGSAMSNLQAKMPTNMPVAGPSQSCVGHSFTNYEDSCAHVSAYFLRLTIQNSPVQRLASCNGALVPCFISRSTHRDLSISVKFVVKNGK